MAKNDKPQDDTFQEEIISIVTIPQHELARFENYLNPYDMQEFKNAMPEWIAGDALVGHLIAIHSLELQSSFQYKTEFYKAEIEIAGLQGKYTATFFGVAARTTLNAIIKLSIPLPVMFGVIRQGSTYALQDVNKFLANNR